MSDNNNKDFEGLGKLLDHNYDNIRELDNPLPGWWLLTFYGTVIFGIGYFLYYQFLGGPTHDQQLQTALSEVQAQVQAQQAQSAQEPPKDLNALLQDQGVVAKGKATFIGKCAACHGQNGEGLIGPNLTDEYWIHGDGSLPTILEVVKKGVLEKGMPPWESALPKDEVEAVTVYVKTLAGTNPPNAKAPQGEKKTVN